MPRQSPLAGPGAAAPGPEVARSTWLVLGLILLAAGVAQANIHREFILLAPTGGAVLAAAAVAALRTPGDGRLPLGLAGAPLLALLAWSTLALLWSRVPFLTAYELAGLGAAVLAYAAWRTVTAGAPAGFRPLGPGLIAAGLAMAALMIGQAAAGERAMALFLNPNSAAALLNLCWPAAALAWLAREPAGRAGRWGGALLLAALAVMAFASGLEGSRAAWLGGVAALAVVVATGRYALGAAPRRVLIAAAVFALGLLGAHAINALGLGPGSALGEGIASLSDPGEAGHVRFLLWEATWELIREQPWLGLGPGVFWLAYAAVRPPGDGTAGYFAHNDYLQFWAERGLPALLLVLAVGAACAYLFARAARAGRVGALPPGAVAGAGAAFAAVLSAGVHGFFSYNLQLAVFLILLAVQAAELERLAPARPLATVRLPDLRRPLTAVGAAALLAIPGLGLGLMAASQHATEAGLDHLHGGEYEAAERDFRRARQRWDWPDPPWVHHADAYRQALSGVPKEETALRRDLIERAFALLDAAEQRNPLRPPIYALRGVLRRDHPALTDGSARAAFERALELDPRAVQARLAYAQLLRQASGDAAALELLEQGLAYSYGQPPRQLYAAALQMRQATGDTEGAEALRQRLEATLSVPDQGERR